MVNVYVIVFIDKKIEKRFWSSANVAGVTIQIVSAHTGLYTETP